MEQIVLPHLPAHPLRACICTDVGNAPLLRQQLLELLDGNRDFEYAFLDAEVLLSRNQVLAACFRAINDMLNGRMKSRNVHSEIVFSMSLNNNISESFRRFGVGEATKHIVAIKVGGNAPQIQEHLFKHVEGKLVEFTDNALCQIRDVARVQNILKLGDVDVQAVGYVLGSMAVKGS
ncbi:CGI-121-domain-containing protein [Teratosphaeria nubilosa]|uniref:EKC/KEOPS complex subunit CGI121 n=1 Tax=Teratosphaeria nubilosa TaxID=161662 RepID=A0A6G1L4V5_9PEZI|nr:CGI-121-domain-containing protein [Teratosphaeria nubilosa]